jgi:hypothetical protein
MRKRLIHGLGAFALVLGGAPAVGQEKPPVLPPKPVVELAREIDREGWISAIRLLQGQGVIRRSVFLLENSETSQPLMKGDLALTVEEMDRVVQLIADADLRDGLAALGTAERAAMKARRLLPAQKDSVEESTEGDKEFSVSNRVILTSSRNGHVRWFVAGGGEWLTFQRRAQSQPEDRTPMQEAQDSLQQAVTSLRHAADRKEASMALDEMDESVTALRALLWEKKVPRNR